MTLDTEHRIDLPADAAANPPPPPADMFPITKILAPVDLSERAVGAAEYAASLAAGFQAELVFLHAIHNEWPLGQAKREVRNRINAAARGCRFLFREGSPVSVILDTAQAEQADLILVSTRRKPALARLFDGSITAQVLREARCAVWVTPDNQAPLLSQPIRSVVCGLSLGPRASAVLRWSIDLARAFNADLSVIHAGKALEAREEIKALQAGAGNDSALRLESGTPLTAIPPLAGELRADLLVIGKSPQKRFLGDLRTLSYEIACRTMCPVASV